MFSSLFTTRYYFFLLLLYTHTLYSNPYDKPINNPNQHQKYHKSHQTQQNNRYQLLIITIHITDTIQK